LNANSQHYAFRDFIYKGVGLADISIEPHFSPDNTGLLENVLFPFSKTIDIQAMCDGSAIIVDNETAQYFGDIYLVSKERIEKIS